LGRLGERKRSGTESDRQSLLRVGGEGEGSREGTSKEGSSLEEKKEEAEFKRGGRGNKGGGERNCRGALQKYEKKRGRITYPGTRRLGIPIIKFEEKEEPASLG